MLPNEEQVLLPQKAGSRRKLIGVILCQVLCAELRAERPRSNFRKAFLSHSGKSLRVNEKVIQRYGLYRLSLNRLAFSRVRALAASSSARVCCLTKST